MTIVLRETTCVDQTLSHDPPTFKGRAIFAYGHAQNIHGKSFGSGQTCSAEWGAYTETEGVFGGADWGITGVGSLETGAAGHSGPGASFYGEGGGTFTGRLHDPVYGCEDLAFQAALDTSNYVGLMVMGGVSLESAVGDGTFAGAGTHVVTGLGFRPGLLFMGGTGKTSRGGHGADPGQYQNSFGAADAAGNQWAVAAGSNWNVGTSQRISRTVNDAVFLQIRPGLTKADLVSFDADGFTLNVSSYHGAEYFWWFAVADPNGAFAVGTMTEGDASISPGFTPEAFFFASAGNTAYNTDQGGVGLAYGGASDDGTACSGWADAANGNVLSARYWSTKALAWILHPTGGGVVSEAEAVVASWGATCPLTWTTGPGANGIKGGWVAMRTSTGPGYGGCGSVFLPQIYRRRGGAR